MAPPKKYPKFPAPAERQSLIAQLRQAAENGDALSSGELFRDYLDKLTALDKLMNRYSEIDEDFGLPPTLDEKGRTELLQALADTATAGETFLADAQRQIEEDPRFQNKQTAMRSGVPGVVGQVQSLLAQDYGTLRSYDEKQSPMSFPELQQLSRTKVVDFRGKKIGVMRNKLSDRIPMTVVDLRGNRRPGVFTKASYVDFMGKFNSLLQDAAACYDSPAFRDNLNLYRSFLFEHDRPEGCSKPEDLTDEQVVSGMKARVMGILPKYRQYLIDRNKNVNGVSPREIPDNRLAVILASKTLKARGAAGRVKTAKTREATLREQGIQGKELEEAQRKTAEAEQEEAELNELMTAVGLDLMQMPEDVADTLKDGFTDLALDKTNLVNVNYMGLQEGQRYDQRNSAMTAVADLVGMSHIVARSENMKFLDEDGREVEGTFMEFADGLDLHGSKGLKEFNKVAEDPFAPPCTALPQIADLQAFDYLCGNVDRHGGNMSYTVDKDGKFTGIKAFDNDTSFGLLPINKKYGLFRQAGLDDLMVITEDMAKKIKAATPEMLRFTLRGRGLTPEEIEQSCTRLTELKGAVEAAVTGTTLADIKNARKAKKLCVMKTEHLKQIHLNDLPRTGYALFDNVKAQLHTRMQEARKAGHAFEPGALEREGVKKPELTEVSTTDRRYAAGGIADSLSDMDRMIRNEVTAFEVDKLSKFLRSSGKWRDMISAVKEASKAADAIRKRIGKDREALDRNDPRVKEELEKADKAMEKARKATDAYLRRKMDEKHVNDPNALRGLGKHDYEQNRMDYALKLSETIRVYEKFRNPSVEEEQRQEAAAQQLDFANKRKELQTEPRPIQGLQP